MLKKLAAVALFGIMSLQAEIYELRTYTAKDGKLENVLARFRNHTTKLFEKHGMKNIGYWVPADSPGISKHTDLHRCPQKPRSGEGLVGRVSRRSRLGESEERVRSKRRDRGSGCFGIYEPHRLFRN